MCVEAPEIVEKTQRAFVDHNARPPVAKSAYDGKLNEAK